MSSAQGQRISIPAGGPLPVPIDAASAGRAVPPRKIVRPVVNLPPVQQELFPTAMLQTAPAPTLAAAAAVERRRTPRQMISHHWECTVVHIGAHSFTATLRSLRDPSDSEKEAEIPLEAVTPDDLELLQPGAIFYWTIGYDISPSGTRKRASEVRFRRLPAWTKKDVERIRSRATELFELFGKPDSEP
jgi:hypothetical protein